MLSSTLLFFSGQDTIVILLVALVLFGGKKLPELARGLGQGIREFKDASEGVKRDIQEQINKETAKSDPTPPPAPPVQNTNQIPEHSTPVTNTPGTPVSQAPIATDHSEPYVPSSSISLEKNDAPAPTTEHPRETPIS
ncbi:twin-arginine translocase TatA/TatE family subunit [Mucilaginibacter sp. PPCGB 2223]|uniref:Sec-independent protein translocase subunit TatA/TatB n=1 Tax=Mucilaginibacter sp. PPCGB 2223 TaxID=1886027 RepID=UPI0009F206BA|nr:twin-arginine translocase TatA/TatE family subunit [Mucilaginibacter sp. PPCGB 2223]